LLRQRPAQARAAPALALVGLYVLALFAASPARADPRFVWETLDTPHFEIHYHQGEFLLALKVARLAEEAHTRLAPVLAHQPTERCQLVVQDDTDFANGNATPLYYNLIHAYAPPPDPRSTLSDFDDPVWQLVSHEYTHILHLDTVHGVASIFNSVFGKLWIPNGVQPTWLIEGMAVLSESRVTSGGRIRSALEDMSARAMILDGIFPDIDELSNPTLKYPRGDIPYTVGGRLLDYIEDHYGAGALRDLSYDYADRVVPLAMNLNAQTALGKTWLDLYDEYRGDERERALALQRSVRAEGETPIERLTRLGEVTRSPRWRLDGKALFYSSVGPDRLPELRELELPACCDFARMPRGQTYPDDRRILENYGDSNLAIAPDGTIVYSRPQLFQQFETIEDLYRFDPRTGDISRLTRGARASEPDVAPDGSVVFIQRLSAGRTAVSVLAPGESAPRVLFEDPQHAVVAAPHWSPSGNAVVFLRHGESWNLHWITRDGDGLTALTSGRALDRDPSFSPDGRYILFASDRSGIFNIYALRLSDRRLFAVTNVVIAAFEPVLSPDMSQLAMVTYSSSGYDIARMPFDESKLRLVDTPAVTDFNRPPPTPAPPADIYPSRPYNPFPSLLPKWWLPYMSADASGTTFGVVTGGSDVVDRHDYAATVWWSVQGQTPGWSLRYTNHTLYPDISITSSRDLVVPPGYTDNLEHDDQVGIFASFPFNEYERAWSLGVGYDLIHLGYGGGPDSHPPDGRVSRFTAQLSYSDAFRFVRSVSAEQGQTFSITFRVADPAFGSDFAYRQLSASFTRYFAMPWTWNDVPLHHAVAFRIAGGVSRGDLSERHLYGLGGFGQSNLIDTLINQASAPTTVLRGFEPGAFAGESYVAATVEYRFPLLEIERGFWTLPLYLRQLHAAVFSDAGDAFTLRDHDFRLNVGAGAELRAELVLGWYLPTTLRLGCAHGVTRSPDSILDCYAALGGIF